MITFRGKEYPTREIYEPATDLTHTVSTMELGEALIDEHGNPFDDECWRIDGNIFYYCDDEEMLMSDEEILILVFGAD